MVMHGLETTVPEHDRLPALAGADVGRGQPFGALCNYFLLGSLLNGLERCR
jgi:hypothetical protein